MDKTTAWTIGWNAMFHYVIGLQDAGNTDATFERAADYADRYAAYNAATETSDKRIQAWDAYRSYVIMGTMGKAEEVTPIQLEKCETTE